MSNNTSCNSCAFFENHVANAGKILDDAGLCRFNPPVTQPEENSRGLWPVVSVTDWCGHFSTERSAA